MRKFVNTKLSLISILVLISVQVFSQAIPVKIEKNENGYYLTRGGQPYYVNGAGGSSNLQEVLDAGGNSIRTWSAEEAGKVLDKAHEMGLSVMFGLWVGHERHGFNYDDEEAVKKQLARFTEIVKKYKDHPAILLWGIGNEVDLFYSNTKVWYAIQDIAKMVHELDPNHPTTTVTAGLDPKEVELIMERCPDLDIYSCNTYGEIDQVPENIKKFGWEGPFMIPEWGPTGHWEVEKTKWGIPIEQTSKEKAEVYTKRYMDYIWKYKERCVGSYVFLWGQKQETTSTWYGVFTKGGEKTETYDAIQKVWSGKMDDIIAPRLDSVLLDGKQAKESVYLKASEKYTAKAFIEEFGHNTKYIWEVVPESDDIKVGGDLESEPEAMYMLVKNVKGNTAQIKAPSREGAYRLFFYAKNEADKVAYANIPFYVMPNPEAEAAKPVKFKKQKLDASYY
jgi:hypothetical protein